MTHLEYFYEISKIPRPSGNEEKIADYLCEFAQKHGLEYYRDENRNVLINKPASKGWEDVPSFCLQGHTDMVCERDMDSDHDFSKDPIRVYEEDGKLKARGTTLGGDDGAAIAIMLALLESNEEMPALQCLFTAEEETGLFGASSFDYSRIYSKFMINIDGEEEDEILTSCAGGLRVRMQKEYKTYPTNECTRITIQGLAGGHSGSDIDKNRTNASVLAFELISLLDMGVGYFAGGTKENAITPYAVCIVNGSKTAVEEKIDMLMAQIKPDLCQEDANLRISAEKTEEIACLSKEDTRLMCKFVKNIKNGVIRMSDDMAGFVSTSANIGVVKIENGIADIFVSVRAEDDDEKYSVYNEYKVNAENYGFSCEQGQAYPGWKFKKESKLRPLYAAAYKEVSGNNIKISAIHAGLECGIISGALADVDIIAIGPKMNYVHTTGEFLEKASFDRVFETVKLCLKKARSYV